MAERERKGSPPYGGVFVATIRVMDHNDLAPGDPPDGPRDPRAQPRPRRGVELVGLQTGGVRSGAGIADELAEIEGTDARRRHARRRVLPRRHRHPPGAARGGHQHPVRHRRARPSCWSTTCCSPAGRSAPRSTRSATTAAHGPCSWRSWSTGATASCPIRPDYVGKNLPTRRDEVVDVHPDGVDLGEMVK